MTVLNILGTKVYIRMKPTFRGARAPVFPKVPYTADNPTPPQRKARAWLARTAYGFRGTFGTTSNTGHGVAGPMIARKIFDAKPGKGVHGGKKTMREYAIARRVPDTRIRELEEDARGVAVPA
jgi:hypothetical protein